MAKTRYKTIYSTGKKKGKSVTGIRFKTKNVAKEHAKILTSQGRGKIKVVPIKKRKRSFF